MRSKTKRTNKTYVVVALAAGLSLPIFGQGRVLFQNRDLAFGIDAPVYISFNTGMRMDGADPLWHAALLGGPIGSLSAVPPVSPGTLSMLASPDTGASVVGFGTGVDAGYINVGSDTPRVIPGVNWGERAMLQMVAWYGDYPTWDEAFAAHKDNPSGLIGASVPIEVGLPSSPADPMQARLYNLSSFDMIFVPEPSSAILAAFGALVFCATRLRKKRNATCW